LDPSRPIDWSRVLLLQELLLKYDIAVWLDADILITDLSEDITSQLQPDKHLYLVVHEFAYKYGVLEVLNSGVVMMRAGDWSQRFLHAVWNEKSCLHHSWCDQCAMQNVLGYDWGEDNGKGSGPYSHRNVYPSEYADGVGYLTADWNSIPHARLLAPRKFIHYAGMPQYQKLLHMQWDYARFVQRYNVFSIEPPFVNPPSTRDEISNKKSPMSDEL